MCHETRLATVWIALAAFGAAAPVAGTVRVLRATYGANCGAPQGNKTAELRQACDGQVECNYVIDVQVLGDPAPGCAKTFDVDWICRHEHRKRSESVKAEAGLGSPLRLSCGPDPAKVAVEGVTPDAARAAVETAEEENARLRAEVNELAAQLQAQPPPCPPPQLGDLSGFDGQGYRIDTKDDSVQNRQFPAPPNDGDLAAWLDWLNGKLQESINSAMTAEQRRIVAEVEQQRCQGSIYCQISLRREAIASILARR